MFVDPLGLSINLVNNNGLMSSDDIIKITQAIQDLTDDELAYNEETGTVDIIQMHDGDKKVGTRLIRELIQTRKKVTIELTTNEKIKNTTQSKNIYLDSEYAPVSISTINENGEILQEVIPLSILIGHELIHAWRNINNTSIRDGVYGLRASPSMYGGTRMEYSKEEEFQTVGLKYFRYRTTNSGLLNSNQSYFWYPGENDITENMLRMEQGLNLRVAYMQNL